MVPPQVLIANRGEIAVRIIRTAHEMGIAVVAVHAEDDADALHVRRADQVVALAGSGPRAYLDVDQTARAALDTGCTMVHPGYGFLSENAGLARACAGVGLTFIGPSAEVLDLFGDKTRARILAEELGVPRLAGTSGPTELTEARSFLAELPPGRAMLIKAIAGGGGRGMRLVTGVDELDSAFERCRSEALQAFGRADVYVEEYMSRARHVEVQVVGDGTGDVMHLGERECSIQRSHQKIVEIAPCPGMPPELRSVICDAAMRMASATKYLGLGTFEFLIDADGWGPDARVAFIEANPRIQVEHTVTEEVMGVDLVKVQFELADGATLEDLGLLCDERVADGFAVQMRINAESITPEGQVRPSAGTLSRFDLPAGPGVRVDTSAHIGHQFGSRYDSLLAKVVVHTSGDFSATASRARRALVEADIDGLSTNLDLLRRVMAHPDVAAGRFVTSFLEDHLAELTAGPHVSAVDEVTDGSTAPVVDRSDPLAVLDYGKSDGDGSPEGRASSASPAERARPHRLVEAPPGAVAIVAPMQGTVISVAVGSGDHIGAGAEAVVLEAMKMEHVVAAVESGIVRVVVAQSGDTVFEGDVLVYVEPADVDVDAAESTAVEDLDHLRSDLAHVVERHLVGLDEARPESVARRRKTGQRTARENIEDLIDPGTFVEYGPLVLAAQRARHSEEHLIRTTPGDGLVAGVGSVNGDLFPDDRSRCVVTSYDYTVLAGTQGLQNHRKKDRLFELAERQQLPVVLFAEGGGGRPGDTDGTGVAGLDCLAFLLFGRLSALVPLVGITSGRCFAGNAALLGSCDVVIATKGSNIGMGGPAMVEGGGLGTYRPEEIGPLDVQTANGVVDIAVEDEAEAVAVTKRYLSYFQGPIRDWACADQRILRTLIPENRLRVYDVRRVIETLCDDGSVLELRRSFGHGMVTALARIEGRPIGIVSNNPTHLGGAIDAPGADKAVRFMQLCDAFDIPLLFLCDTPGIMVGPQSEEAANVRHAARMFVNGANLSVPFFTIVLRKGYGLGAQAMAGGSFHAPLFTIAWPTGEFGGMGLEGAVKLGYRKELAALEEPAERTALYEQMVAKMYEHGKATSMASHFEIDGVVDPVDSRHWIRSALSANPPPRGLRSAKKRPCVDAW